MYVGEDGPTHQPVEVLAQLRAFPNVYLFRPADGKEVIGAYLYDTKIHPHKTITGPVVILGTRQNLPQLAGTSELQTLKGAYLVHEAGKDKKSIADITIIATGSEVNLAVGTADLLAGDGLYVRVVSAPCLELFDEQPQEYRAQVLGVVPILSVEAGITFGWEKYAHASVGINNYGFSAPGDLVYTTLGMNKDNIKENALKLIKYYTGKQVPDKSVSVL